MRKNPEPSETAGRTFSMSAGLEASPVTPGRAAPEESRVDPAIEACASAVAGRRVTTAIRSTPLRKVRINWPPVRVGSGDVAVRVSLYQNRHQLRGGPRRHARMLRTHGVPVRGIHARSPAWPPSGHDSRSGILNPR